MDILQNRHNIQAFRYTSYKMGTLETKGQQYAQNFLFSPIVFLDFNNALTF